MILLALWVMVAALSPAAAAEGTPITEGESCVSASCHVDTGTKAFVHEPAADGESCETCHETITVGRHGFQLVVEESELCAVCHDMLAEQRYLHAPVETGDCTACHDPHQSDYEKQLVVPREEICTVCHEVVDTADRVVHGPVEEGRCIECHDPHASAQPMQLVAAVPDLCFRCHDRRVTDAEGRTLPATRAAYQDTEGVRHAPFEVGECQVCHAPHASPDYRLLVEPLPDSVYASFATEKYFCLGCHDESAFIEARTTTATDFRNGNLNLHFRHVNRIKGRTCRTCHEHHAGPSPALIRSTPVPGAEFIAIDQFERTERGGTCSPTCHRTLAYDRSEPIEHGLQVTPREGESAPPGAVDESRNPQKDR